MSIQLGGSKLFFLRNTAVQLQKEFQKRSLINNNKFVDTREKFEIFTVVYSDGAN